MVQRPYLRFIGTDFIAVDRAIGETAGGTDGGTGDGFNSELVSVSAILPVGSSR